MSDDLLRPALDTFAQGDLQGAVEMLDACEANTAVRLRSTTPSPSLPTCSTWRLKRTLFPVEKS